MTSGITVEEQEARRAWVDRFREIVGEPWQPVTPEKMTILGCQYAFQGPSGAWYITHKHQPTLKVPHWRVLQAKETAKA
eukprot:5282950-Amphidinium_carterae.1